jgi:hypothetical protein
MGSGNSELVDFRQRFSLLFSKHFAQMALLDVNGNLIATNPAWRSFGCENGLRAEYDCVGKSYLQICEAAALANVPGARSAYLGLLEVIHAGRPKFTMVYPCHSPAERRWYRLWIEPQMPSVPAIVVAHYPLPEPEQASLRSEREFDGSNFAA